MAYRVELSARAEADIKEAYAYIREHGPANPDDWKSGLEEKLASLETMPERFGLAPESNLANVAIHQTFYGNFRILFTVREQRVYVVTVRHGARRFLRRKDLRDLQ
jgi:plasmid stabilization system protein ParE